MTKIEAEAYLRDQVPQGSTLTIVNGKQTRRQYQVVQVYKGTQDLSPWIAYWLGRIPLKTGLPLERHEDAPSILQSLAMQLFGDADAIRVTTV